MAELHRHLKIENGLRFSYRYEYDENCQKCEHFCCSSDGFKISCNNDSCEIRDSDQLQAN